MEVGYAEGNKFGEIVCDALEVRFEGLYVWAKSPNKVPDDVFPIAEVGGLTVELTAESWETVAEARDAVQDGFDQMGLAWEMYDERERRDPAEGEMYQVMVVSENLTQEHIDRSPWDEH